MCKTRIKYKDAVKQQHTLGAQWEEDCLSITYVAVADAVPPFCTQLGTMLLFLGHLWAELLGGAT